MQHIYGIPQRRIRTFYFFWQSPTVPMLQYQTRWKFIKFI